MNQRERSRIIEGLSVADGVAIGKAKIMGSRLFPTEVPQHTVPEDDLDREVERFRSACSEAADELKELVERVETEVGSREADLVRPQIFMAEDPAFVSEVEELIIEEHWNAEAAVAEVVDKFEKMFDSIEDSYLRERSTDLRDAGQRVLAQLLFTEGEMAPQLIEPSVVVSEHLVPSLTVHLDRSKLLGFATEQGGYTSHAAILARSLGIPAVTRLEGVTDAVVEGQTIVADGLQGRVVVNPSEERLEDYRRTSQKFWARRRQVMDEVGLPSETRDGVKITVQANIGRPEEVKRVSECQAEGVGLYRTEFEYLSQTAVPDEDELADHYGSVAEEIGEDGVVFRTLDIGGDKYPPGIPLAHEENPFLGLRGLRLLLKRAEDIAMPQLRALTRAARRGTVKIMYPMVASTEDLEAALKLAEEAREQVEDEVEGDAPEMEQGCMVEIPSAVHILPELLERCDFASVGTNDLVQYTLAADRNSERMAASYDPFHPAILRALRRIREAGREKDTKISICGETAGDTHFLPLLLGLGYDNLSVNVGSVPYVKRAVRRVSLEDCEELAQAALDADTTGRIRALAEEFYDEYLHEPEEEE